MEGFGVMYNKSVRAGLSYVSPLTCWPQAPGREVPVLQLISRLGVLSQIHPHLFFITAHGLLTNASSPCLCQPPVSVQSVSPSIFRAWGDTNGRNGGICSCGKYVLNGCHVPGKGVQRYWGYCGKQGSHGVSMLCKHF